MLDEGGRVVVTDFGIARMGESALTRTGAMMGTSSYLSPEQAQGRPADERSDLYSLGVVLYEMLTGRVPFRGENDVAVAVQHVSTAPPNPRTLAPGIPEAIAGVVMRALSKDPDDRYQTAEEFAAALRAARRGSRGTAEAAASASVPAPSVPPPSVPASPSPTAAATPATPGPTAIAAEAPTRYRSAGAEPATTVRPRRRRGRRLVLALVVLAVAVAGAWAAYALLVAPGATVPKVVGERRADAARALRGEGLRPVLHYVWADRYAEGEVARQSPRGGAKVDDGVKVDLWVSRGPLHLPAPDLGGLASSVALGRLEAESLSGRSRKAASETVPAGQIFRQRPAAGATVERGDTVTYWVSSGPPKILVPDVVGLSQGDAAGMLEDAGFTVNTDYVAGWGEIPGTVLAQDPAVGTKGRAGDEVVIEVAVF